MKHRAIALIPTILFAAMTASRSLAAEDLEGVLGSFPLCEASAALLVKCPDADGQCLLVGDNEQTEALYWFRIQGQKLAPDTQQAFALKGAGEIADIEALAQKGDQDGKVLAFGSHSRNSKCEEKGKRHQFVKVDWPKHETTVVDSLRNKAVTCDNLLAGAKSDATTQAVCKAIDDADAKAAEIERDLKKGKITEDEAKQRCNAEPAYNAEGAVIIHPAKGKHEAWIGLRSPLLPASPSQPEKKRLAILLHMKNLDAYAFDRVALLDLGGRGVRDLSTDGSSIWVIAGPPEDKAEPFELRRFPLSALDESKLIEPEKILDLPNSSEGLAISGKTAYVAIDGDKGSDKNAKACAEPARFKIVTLP